MTTQIRTWEERGEVEGQPTSWHVSINGKPVPGGYIKLVEGGYEVHYPHLTPTTYTTLEVAKRAIELAPPMSHEGMKVARPIKHVEEDDLISTDEAGEMLGVSRYRVNAMVSNGVLSGTRRDGRTLVSRKSVEAKLAGGAAKGPKGRFANAFICYHPTGDAETWTIAEVDTQDEDDVYVGNLLVESVNDSELPECVEVLDYRTAMARCSRARKGLAPGGVSAPVTLDDLLEVREGMLLEAEAAAGEAEAAEAAGSGEAAGVGAEEAAVA